MRKKWLVIMPLLLVFCSCGVGLNKASKQKIEDVQRQINELNGNFRSVQQEIQTLNNNLGELKSAIARLANVLESINKKMGVTLTIKSLFAP